MDAVTRWKTIATIAMAFSAGSLIGIACQDAGKASADTAEGGSEDGGDEGSRDDGGSDDGGADDGGGTAPPGGGGAGRAVLGLSYTGAAGEDQHCVDTAAEITNYCACPSGFSPVGVSTVAAGMYEMVCLED